MRFGPETELALLHQARFLDLFHHMFSMNRILQTSLHRAPIAVGRPHMKQAP
jgi:hypothetical protein